MKRQVAHEADRAPGWAAGSSDSTSVVSASGDAKRLTDRDARSRTDRCRASRRAAPDSVPLSSAATMDDASLAVAREPPWVPAELAVGVLVEFLPDEAPDFDFPLRDLAMD